jgi:hypothetical protein
MHIQVKTKFKNIKLLIRNKVGIGQTRQQSLTAAGKQWEVVVGKKHLAFCRSYNVPSLFQNLYMEFLVCKE